MWALSLWTKYAPSNSSLANFGPVMLTGLWDTMGEYYNANLKNFAGPYDRTYGNGMRSIEVGNAWCLKTLCLRHDDLHGCNRTVSIVFGRKSQGAIAP
jgi:hypothetical protein